MRIAMLAPPWIPVPPPGYGGIEEVIDLLCEELVDRGHDVTLFGAPGCASRARCVAILDAAHPHEIGQSIHEIDHVARAFDQIDAGDFDVVHDHCPYAALAFAERLRTPLVHTVHGPFSAAERAFYEAHATKATVVCISETQRAAAPAAVAGSPVVPNPMRVADWPLVTEKEDYLLWVGRLCPDKGPDRAIRAARVARLPIVVAGVVQPQWRDYFHRVVEPLLDGVNARYIGEVQGERKTRLFARARALLMPIRWNEPFGLVMVEALCCGTPVLAFAQGAARQIVVDGQNGFLVEDEIQMAAAVARLDEIDPYECRRAANLYDVSTVVDGYERVYRQAAGLPRSGRFTREAAAVR